MKPALTIVIPYYKVCFLDAALGSLAQQTNRNFDVFVGDDASLEPPQEVIQKYQNKLKLTYHRFSENLGQTSLVQHWNRCVRKTSSEWIWLFSDDDLISPQCVEAFYKTLEETSQQFDLYRFDLKIIDQHEALLHQPLPHPVFETAAEFVFAKLNQGRCSCAVEYIFRRTTFESAKGFVDFPVAWFSDDASWITFARPKGIRTISDGEVSWRQSGLNLSRPNPQHTGAKLLACRKYLQWLNREFPDPNWQQKLRHAVQWWLPTQVELWGGKPPLLDGIKFWVFFSAFTHHMNLRLLQNFLGVPRLSRVRMAIARRLRRLASQLDKSWDKPANKFLEFAPPGHFYSPIPDSVEIQNRSKELFRQGQTNLPGIVLNTTRQLGLVSDLAQFGADYAPPFDKTTAVANGSRFFQDNGFFEGIDAYAYYAFLRYYSPRQIFEVGSGFSSALALDVAQRFLSSPPKMTFVDPYPERLDSLLGPEDRTRAKVLVQPIQQTDPILFESLNAGDFLFIDSSHISKIGSDVNYLYFEAIPRLKSGVLIHIHDVFWPFEYPQSWYEMGRCWNEDYLLRALLIDNRRLEILHFNSYLRTHHADALSRYPAWAQERGGGSLWLQVK